MQSAWPLPFLLFTWFSVESWKLHFDKQTNLNQCSLQPECGSKELEEERRCSGKQVTHGLNDFYFCRKKQEKKLVMSHMYILFSAPNAAPAPLKGQMLLVMFDSCSFSLHIWDFDYVVALIIRLIQEQLLSFSFPPLRSHTAHRSEVKEFVPAAAHQAVAVCLETVYGQIWLTEAALTPFLCEFKSSAAACVCGFCCSQTFGSLC